jgi:hypothetical protein
LAYHREEAGDHAAAVRHWLTAGKRNARRGANAEAIRCFERALCDIKELPDRDASKRLELDVLLALVPVFMADSPIGARPRQRKGRSPCAKS